MRSQLSLERLWLLVALSVLLVLSGCGKKIAPSVAFSEQAGDATYGSATVKKGLKNLEQSDRHNAEQFHSSSEHLAGFEEEEARQLFQDDSQSGRADEEKYSPFPQDGGQLSVRQLAGKGMMTTGLRDVFFEFDRWELTREAKQILEVNAAWLKEHRQEAITIEGHCDERGTRDYNYVLGHKRAMVTRQYLTALGVSSDQLRTTSYGKDNPICGDLTDLCFQKNRRAHLVLGMQVAAR